MPLLMFFDKTYLKKSENIYWIHNQHCFFLQFEEKAFFDEGDRDNDGFISKEEHYAEVSHLNHGGEKMWVKKHTTFIKMYTKPPSTFRDSYVSNEVNTYFDMMDSNGDGNLSSEELKKGFGVLRYNFILMLNFWWSWAIPKSMTLIMIIYFCLLGISVREFSRPLMHWRLTPWKNSRSLSTKSNLCLCNKN